MIRAAFIGAGGIGWTRTLVRDIVSVPELRDTVFSTPVAKLPDACASICNAMVAPQRLAVKAALTGDVNLLKQSMMLDPLTAAAATSPEIWRMTDELLVAQAEFLPQYAGAIADAKARLAHDAELPLRDVWPGTRYHPRTVEEMMSDPECNLREWALRIFTGQHVRAQ